MTTPPPSRPPSPKSPTRTAFQRVFWASVTLLVLLMGACGVDQEDSVSYASAESIPATTVASFAAATDIEETLSDDEPSVDLATAQAALGEAAANGGDTTEAAQEVSDGDSATEQAVTASEQEEPAEGPDENQAPTVASDSSEPALVELSTATSPAAFGRDVIYRARVQVEVADVTSATREAIAIVQGVGGFVFGQQTSTRPLPFTEIVFKLPPEEFSVALSRLAQVGELVDQQITADDVTERIVDVGSRIITAEASVARLRSFLETATNLENVAFYERELLTRETDLERLRGQLRTLQDQVALATITLTLTQRPASPIILPNTGLLVTAWVSPEGEDPCLGEKAITVERDATVAFCVEVANQGEVPVVDVQLSSDVLPLDDNPFVLERGSFDRIEPGQFLTATVTEQVVKGRLADHIATRGLGILIEANAAPLHPDNPQLAVINDRTRVMVTAQEVVPSTGVIIHAWVSGRGDDPCLGNKDITVKPDDDLVHFCLFVGNPAQAPLTNIELRSAVLDFQSNPPIPEHGGFERIEPGQFVTATVTEPIDKGRLNGRVATRGLEIEVGAVAIPLNPDGLEMNSVTNTSKVIVTAQEVVPVTQMLTSVWTSAGDDDPCLGTQDIILEPHQTQFNLCLEIGNLGETTLTDISVESVSLRLGDNPFVTEHGNFDRLEPGEFMTATLTEPVEGGRVAGRIAARGVNVAIAVTATPVDEEGKSLDDVMSGTQFRLVARPDQSPNVPTGFGDAFQAGLDTLGTIAGALAVVIGGLLPLSPLIAILVAGYWWVRRRRRRGAESDPSRSLASADDLLAERPNSGADPTN